MALTILPTVKGYARYSEALTIADSAGANAVTVNGTTLPVDVSNTKFIVTVTVTETSAGDGAYDVKLQASADGTNWADVDTSLAMDVDPTGTNTDTGIADASGTYAPYWRLVLFTDGTDTQDAAAATMTFAVREVDLIRTV